MKHKDDYVGDKTDSVPIDFECTNTMEVNRNQNCLVINILLNILFCDQQMKKKMHIGLLDKIRESYRLQNIHFWVDYPFKFETHYTSFA